jgi:hypothetical protein
MIFVADEIPIELRRIVEFLNKQMDPAQVLALEVRQYTGNGKKALVPQVVGQTAEEAMKKENPRGEVWTESRFLKALEISKGGEDVSVAKEILAWAKKNKTDIYWGRGRQWGKVSPGFEHEGKWFYPFSVTTRGSVQINFGDTKSLPPFESKERRLELLAKLNSFLREELS